MDQVECYSLRLEKWITLQEKLNEGRHSASSCAINDRIYVFGGKNDTDQFCPTFEWYDAETQIQSLLATNGLSSDQKSLKWNLLRLNDPNLARTGHYMTSLAGSNQLIVFGGKDKTNWFIFDVTTEQVVQL